MNCDEPSTSTAPNLKAFSQLGYRQKKRRTEVLRIGNAPEELAFATKLSMQAEGNKDIAAVLSYLIDNPEDASRIRALCESKINETQTLYTKEKALAVMISLQLSKLKYIRLREISIEHGVNPYPSYYKVQQAKQDCYPPAKAIRITDTSAEINLQAVLDLTVHRMLKVFDIEKHHEIDKFILISKWGFDGATGQSIYKQRVSDEIANIEKPIHQSIFISSLVPLKLMDGTSVVWENSHPSSTKYCRPIKFEFVQESTELIKREYARIKNEIDHLTPTSIQDNIFINHQLLLTMIDGKICSTLAESSSSMRCYICGASPKEMNKIDIVVQKQIESEHYKFGLSSLHAWIRSMEYLLHVSYNLEIKKWSVRNAQDKIARLERKKRIQQKFREKLGLLVDFVKQGVGTTNDGNTARRFFANSSITTNITGLDEGIIRNFAILLQVIASGQQIDVEKFDRFARTVAELLVQNYPWYYMPVSVHKILIHGAAIIKHCLIPIGQLLEEVIEARHKEFRQYRENNTRKSNRTKTNEDILHSLLISSDPYITSLRPQLSKSMKKELLPEALELLKIRDDVKDEDITMSSSEDSE